MALQGQDIMGRVKSYFTDMMADVLVIYSEKGFLPFKRPLTIAVPSLLLLYVAVYSPISSKLSREKRSVVNMTAVAQHAEEYENIKTRMRGLQRRLPLIKDKADWLSYLITSSARNVGVVIDSQGAQRETEVGGYYLVSRDVAATASYEHFGKWIAEIENAPIFVRITELTLTRDDTNPGVVKGTMVISTVFPRPGGTGGGI